MNLHTSRLIIRNFQDEDLDALLAYRNDPEVARYQGWSVPYLREKGKALIADMKEVYTPMQGQWLQLAVEIKETGEMIGDVAVRIHNHDSRQAIVGITIALAYWRKGYGTESMTAVLNYLFNTLELHRVEADCDTRNTASWKLLEKLGFRREGHFIENFFDKGGYEDEYRYGLLQREWRNKTGVE